MAFEFLVDKLFNQLAHAEIRKPMRPHSFELFDFFSEFLTGTKTILSLAGTHSARLILNCKIEKLKGVWAHRFPNLSMGELVKKLVDQELERHASEINKS